MKVCTISTALVKTISKSHFKEILTIQATAAKTLNKTQEWSEGEVQTFRAAMLFNTWLVTILCVKEESLACQLSTAESQTRKIYVFENKISSQVFSSLVCGLSSVAVYCILSHTNNNVLKGLLSATYFEKRQILRKSGLAVKSSGSVHALKSS